MTGHTAHARARLQLAGKKKKHCLLFPVATSISGVSNKPVPERGQCYCSRNYFLDYVLYDTMFCGLAEAIVELPVCAYVPTQQFGNFISILKPLHIPNI